MYVLYGAPARASCAPEAILEEIGAAYRFIHLEPEDARRDLEYRKLNPQGQIPTLVDGDRAIWESAAICVHLTDRHPEVGLAPPAGSPDRGRFYQWLFFLSNTLQPTYMLYYYPERFCDDPQGQARVAKGAAERVEERWKELDRALLPGPYLLGETFSACDIYLYMLATWHEPPLAPLSRFGAVARHMELVGSRPAVRRMMARNGGG